MRTTFTTIALALTLSAGAAAAAEIRVLCVGSTQVAAKTLAADFTKQNGHTVTVTSTAPFNIDKELTAKLSLPKTLSIDSQSPTNQNKIVG